MLDIDLKPKHFRELKNVLYIIHYMVDGMNSTDTMNQFTTNLITHSVVCDN